MKVFTIDDIRSWEPCYDPSEYLPEDWKGTALDILRMDNAPVNYRLWVVLREEVLDSKTLRLFELWCAWQALAAFMPTTSLVDNPNKIAEKYANGEAEKKELQAAAYADDDAWAAADTSLAARAADATARAAARLAAARADSAARADAAYYSARKAQVQKLIEMISS